MSNKMPPTHYQAVERRSASASKTFTIIFVLIIVLVAFLCLLWGFIIPRFKKRFPGRPVSTRFNGFGRAGAFRTDQAANPWPTSYQTEYSLNPPRTFPAHPGVMARSDKVPPRPRGAVLVYNPHTETPFANSPPSSEPVRIPCNTPRPSTSLGSRNSNLSRGPFSPSPSNNRLLSVDTRGSDEAANMTQYHEGIANRDTTEYRLATPEPLTFQPRGAGRPPPLSRQLEKFPLPQSRLYSGTIFEVHPKKLFTDLDQETEKVSIGGSTEITQSTKPHREPPSDITSGSSSNFIEDKYFGDYRQQLQVVATKSLKSAHGDFAAASSSHIHRAGTITRPRTPVAEYRELYEKAAAEARAQPFRSISLKRELTSSTNPLTASSIPLSVDGSVSTPPTSIGLPDKHLSLLPTPLRIKRDHILTLNSPTPEMPHERFSSTPSSAALPESPDKLGSLRHSVRRKRMQRKSIGFYHPSGKPRSAGNNFKNRIRNLSPRKLSAGEAKSSESKSWAPGISSTLLAARTSIGQGSSRYSRDTKGISIIRTPITEDFTTPTRSDFQNLWSSEESRRRKSLDLIQSKIDCWDLPTADVHFDPNESTPSLKHKRTCSDFGPRSPSLPTGTRVFKTEASNLANLTEKPSIERYSISRVGIEEKGSVFGNQHEISSVRPPTRGKQRLQAEQSAFSTWTTSDSNLSSLMSKSAPGNAEWI